MKTIKLGIKCGRLPEDTGNDIPVILEKFGLLKDGTLNHAAPVLFGKHERMKYPQCLLRLARFRGTDKMVFMDSQRIHDNILTVPIFFNYSMPRWLSFSNILPWPAQQTRWNARNILPFHIKQ